jgi:hypothetical protein
MSSAISARPVPEVGNWGIALAGLWIAAGVIAAEPGGPVMSSASPGGRPPGTPRYDGPRPCGEGPS